MTESKAAGHIAALFTILIWGTTFISTKTLLNDFSPVQILVYRFILGCAALFTACPRLMKDTDRKKEIYFAGAGLCGITMYYLLENIALTMELASNVSIILSAAPFFTAILTHIIDREDEPLCGRFFVGFAVAMTGIIILCLKGEEFRINPAGDILAVTAAAVWAVYSVIIRRINSFGYSTIQSTRRVFEYGILFMIPVSFLLDFHWEFAPLGRPVNLLNILYLGIGASAACFVTWNYALKAIGTVRASAYIYAIPAITVIAAVVILGEPLTAGTIAGIVLTLTGLLISEYSKSRE